jgi:glucan phosphoethanolaminetransferase (alkaline phosphatase superfamily)
MAVVVLTVWLLTAGLGSYLATVWIRHGGLRQRRMGVTRLPVWLVLGHVALAATGLLAWLLFLFGHVRASAWAACAVILVVASFGFMMLFRWLPSSGRHAHAETTAERHFPIAAVVAHGGCAVATVVLVVVTVVYRP